MTDEHQPGRQEQEERDRYWWEHLDSEECKRHQEQRKWLKEQIDNDKRRY